MSYAPEQMYDLVADIESYPQFLRYCVGAQVLEKTDDGVVAGRGGARGPVHQSFSTRNDMLPGRRIDLSLLKGPFSSLSGCWEFQPVGEGGCRVRLQLDFEMRGALKFIVTPLITEVAGQLLQAMVKRADQIYGKGV